MGAEAIAAFSFSLSLSVPLGQKGRRGGDTKWLFILCSREEDEGI